jgi:hypothetical protein
MGRRRIKSRSPRGALHPRMERRLTYGEIVKAKGAPIAVDATFNDSSKIHAASMCVQVAEVDRKLDGRAKSSLTHGTVLNPLMHQDDRAKHDCIGYT